MASSSNLEHHKLTRFFFTISVFITATSVLAVYTTIMTTHYGIKKDDLKDRHPVEMFLLFYEHFTFLSFHQFCDRLAVIGGGSLT